MKMQKMYYTHTVFSKQTFNVGAANKKTLIIIRVYYSTFIIFINYIDIFYS